MKRAVLRDDDPLVLNVVGRPLSPRGLDVDFAQGYPYARPASAEAVRRSGLFRTVRRAAGGALIGAI